MSLRETLLDVWRQSLQEGRAVVVVGGVEVRVGRTAHAGLRVLRFSHEGRPYEGIEQNPGTRSRWAEMARAGHQIMQFKTGNRYVANVRDGVLTVYPAWKALNLPD